MTDQKTETRPAAKSDGSNGRDQMTPKVVSGVQSVIDRADQKLRDITLSEDDPGKLLRLVQDGNKAKAVEADAEGRVADAQRKLEEGLDFDAARNEVLRRLSRLATIGGEGSVS